MNLALAVPALRRALFDGSDYVDAFNAVIDAGSSASVDDKNAAIGALLADLDGASSMIVGELAVASGALVEQGGSSIEAVDVLVAALADGAEALAAGVKSADAFERLVVGAMARFARSIEARRRARVHPRLDEAIRRLSSQLDSVHVFYVVEILDMLDDAPILVVDTGADTVTRLRVTGIRNCFHLMTLLEGHDPFALTGDSVSTSRGYYTWRYLAVAGGSASEIIVTMLPGDLRALDIPSFDGTRVVVRTPKGVRRSWDASFVSPIHDQLGATLVSEARLTPAEASALRDRMSRSAL